MDEGRDDTCLEIQSSDPDENTSVLSLIGSGSATAPPPTVVDLDIAKLSVTGRATLLFDPRDPLREGFSAVR